MLKFLWSRNHLSTYKIDAVISNDLPGLFFAERARDPRMQVMVDLSSENINRHLSQLMV